VRALWCVALCAALACGAPEAPDASGPVAEWPFYGGDAAGTRYSPLTQIAPANVRRLEVAWVHHSGDFSPGVDGRDKTAFEASPLVVDGTLYYCTPSNRVFALDPETGAERWVWDPGIGRTGSWTRTCRGLAHARVSASGACASRIFTATMDARLVALDARSGRPCADFGEDGAVDLRRGVGARDRSEYGVTSPPTVIGDVVAVGALVADGRRVDMPSGVVRGFDVRSGALRWAFDPLPPGRSPPAPGPDGEPRYALGTPNAWSIFAADPQRDLLFVPTGNPSPDFFGGQRDGIDRYGSSVVALRGSTGALVWHFQTVHHDLWDYDVASQPTLLDLRLAGGSVPALLQATKVGHLFLLRRDTGEPIFPVEERPVPQSDLPGEHSAPTQPFPTHPAPLLPERIGPDSAWGLTPWDRAACRRRIAALRSEGPFTPPSLRGSLEYPGVAGGADWGGAAVDPERGLAVLNLNRLGVVSTAVPRAQASVQPTSAYAFLHPQEGTPYAERVEQLVSPLGVPCTAPPWGELVAIDLASGRVRWREPFGTTRDMAPFPFWFAWGMPSMGGPIVTASGLVFIGASMDAYLRAYDLETGTELFRARLPFPAQATPITYRLRRDGRQFVVIAAGGHASMHTRLGDALVAFALPAPAE
jgi:quinoprotein glucose dehydrogenase